MTRFLFIALLLSFSPALLAERTVGVAILGRAFCEYVPGELPVVMAVPHGGRLKPDEVATQVYLTRFLKVELNGEPVKS